MNKTESFFRFQITQTTKVLLYKIKMGDGKRWILSADDDSNALLLRDMKRSQDNVVKINVYDGALRFETVHGFVYLVQDRKPDGANVSFHGPVNALLTQSLMPRMTYVPGTLLGMSSETQPDAPETQSPDREEEGNGFFVPIAEFMAQREQRHNGRVNPQDKFGWRVNMNFNNELVPWFPPFKTEMREKPKKKSGKFFRG